MSPVGVSLLKAGVELSHCLPSGYVLYGAEHVIFKKSMFWKLLDRGEATKDDAYLGQIASSFFLALVRVGGYKITLGWVSNNRLVTRHMPCVEGS